MLTRTMLDLASCLPEPALEIALDSAARGNPEFFLELHEFLSGVDPHGRDGIGTLTALVALRRHGEPTGSPFETRLYRLLRRARLPEPVKQHPGFDGRSQPFTFIDFAWPARRIALSADGASYHLARLREALPRAGTRHVRFRAALNRQGWRGRGPWAYSPPVT